MLKATKIILESKSRYCFTAEKAVLLFLFMASENKFGSLGP